MLGDPKQAKPELVAPVGFAGSELQPVEERRDRGVVRIGPVDVSTMRDPIAHLALVDVAGLHATNQGERLQLVLATKGLSGGVIGDPVAGMDETAQRDIDLIKTRLKRAEDDYRAKYVKGIKP